jgi:hypothetical protein
MSLKKEPEHTCRIGLISWPVHIKNPPNTKDMYLILGEIYDKDIRDNLELLRDFNQNLEYLYPFKVKKNGDVVKIYNNDDINHLRKKYKLTSTVSLRNYQEGEAESEDDSDDESEKIVFRTPRLYDISCMEPLFPMECFTLKCVDNSTHCRVFIVLPYSDPVLRGQILKQCIFYTKDHHSLFLLIGGKHGQNKETTSTLMKRYLLSSGVSSQNINKSIYDKFPDSIVESLEILPFLLDINHHVTHDLFIACASYDMCKVMSFSRDIKVQFICE